MDVFQTLQDLHYGELHLVNDPETGLRGVVALHNTNLGPAIGGCRAIRYATSDAAVIDALRLARGMAYKAAITGLPHGGGKAVIRMPDNDDYDRRTLFQRFGAFVDQLNGRYITCEDSGTSPSDIDHIASRTKHVLGTSAGSGDPSPLTAMGVRRGIEAAVEFQLKRDSLAGLHIAIQGVGHVGHPLALELHGLGARLTIADVNEANVARTVAATGATVVSVDEILATPCDVLAPCALGAVINDKTLPTLRTRIVAGAANNQLAEPRHGVALFQKGILYAPDYAINAGGLINVAVEYGAGGYDRARAVPQIQAIYETMWQIFSRSQHEDAPTHVVADRIAEERMFGRALA